MKKKIIRILSVFGTFVFFFGIFSYKQLGNHFSVIKGNLEYLQKQYEKAEMHYLGFSDIGLADENRSIVDYDIADSFYGMKAYTGALQFYAKVKENNPDMIYFKYHNIGNAFYRLGQSQNDNQKIQTWQNSLDAYEKSLNSKTALDKKETVANYEFVKKKLDELKKKKQDEQKGQEEKQKEQDQKEDHKDEGKQEDHKKDDQNNQQQKEENKGDQSQAQGDQPKSWVQQGQFNQLGQNGSENDTKMSQDEKNELDQYSQYLKEFQKQNGSQLNRGDNGGTQSNLYQQFLNNINGNPQFQNGLPAPDKDW